jgi:hypothetical protein
MQNSGYGNPPIGERIETIPLHPGALTAADQNAPPQPSNATHEDTQLTGISGNGMILVIPQHNLPKPRTNFDRTMMLPIAKFSLDGFQLRDHSLLRRDPPDDEWSGGELSTEVGETQERKGFRLSLATPLSVNPVSPSQ